jgi:hypothetical protein
MFNGKFLFGDTCQQETFSSSGETLTARVLGCTGRTANSIEVPQQNNLRQHTNGLPSCNWDGPNKKEVKE